MSETKPMSEAYYNQSLDNLIRSFNTDPKIGLKSSEIEGRHLQSGYNELPKIKKSVWRIYLAPLFNFLIVIMIVTGIIIVFLGSPGSTIITWTVIFINSFTAIVQQLRAQKALDSLRKISALSATVIRGGEKFEIPTRDLVPGDIISIDQGDKIPADGRIIKSMNLTIDEAPLTGESEPVEKIKLALEKENLAIQKQYNMAFMGTFVKTGRGKVLITGTGINTEIGKISNQLNEMGSIEDIPLTRKLNRLGYILGTIVIINLIILIIYKFTLLQIEGNFVQAEITQALTDSLLRAMNIVPINLPLLSTLVLITGVLTMAQSGVIIKNLSSIESLGRVSVICSDKTGTITKNEMTVASIYINGQDYDVTGAGYDGDGKIYKDNNVVSLSDNQTFNVFIDSIVLNNNAGLSYEDVKVRVGGLREKAIRRALGSPTEAALLVLAEKAGYIPYDVEKKYEILTEFSFNSELKRMTTICKDNVDNVYAFIKGAPEGILEISSQIETNGKNSSFEEKSKEEVLASVQKHAKQGFRTLAVAYKTLSKESEYKRENIELDVVFLGFVSILDPPREGVEESVKTCRKGGIKVVMVTGDHPAVYIKRVI